MTVLANPFLARPSARLLLVLGPTPLRIATEELYVPALGGVHFERGLSGEPSITFGLTDPVSGVQTIDAAQFTLGNADRRYSSLYTSESRGFAVILYAWDKNTDELQTLFRGVLATRQLQPGLLLLGATSLNAAMLVDKIPRRKITQQVFRTAFDMGKFSSRGWGVAERVPGRYVKRRVAPGDPSHYDYDFGVGNLGIDRVYEGSVPAELANTSDTIDVPPTYPFERLTGEYFYEGEYDTVIRFPAAQGGLSTGDLKPVTANVQRVYPDHTADTLLDLKWKGDFRDDALPAGARNAHGFGSGCPEIITPSRGGSTSWMEEVDASVAFDAELIAGGGAGGGGAGGGGAGQ